MRESVGRYEFLHQCRKLDARQLDEIVGPVSQGSCAQPLTFDGSLESLTQLFANRARPSGKLAN